jgi:hypothetical protein
MWGDENEGRLKKVILKGFPGVVEDSN